MAKEATEKEFDQKMIEKIVKLRNDGAKWDEISGQLDIPNGKAMQLWACGTVPKKEIVKNATAKDIVRLRDHDSLSWGQIVARVRYPESRCRSMYEEEQGDGSTKGNRIGKGGRHPGDGAGESKPKGTKAAKGTKSAPKPPKRSPLAESLDGMDAEAITAALTGRAIKVSVGGGDEETVKVKAVKAVKNGSITVTDADTKKARAFKISAITAVSKAVVVK